ncbi:LysR family transcriptional regulator [Nitratireductor sp. CAU 1489]|uniref:LysR family transcriptional regulator n=1 Tax=Nitratireductor arenosus TaxID=2682096 RepID=A0A844QDS3_9HYPH|nr:LysR family transcriptional regulator [Nitratireductor arenosus]MVA96248.1 LysR family transcriptional regulator [Nitratireductor arenosus]
MNITLRQLRAFYEVAKTQSFTLAASNMKLTQSAVSMLVRQLEAEYGLALFNRVQRSAQLTEVGRQMLPITERMLEDLRQVHEGAADLKALRRGTLRIAVPQMLACSWLPPLAAEFMAAFPDIGLHVMDTTGDRIVSAVQDNEAEIGIGPQRPAPAEIAAEPLWEEPIQVALPRNSPLGDADCLTWKDLRGENWIQYSDDFTLYLERTIWAKLPIPDARTTNVRYLTTALSFVGLGLGVTAAPQYARSFADQFAVRFARIEAGRIMRAFYIYSRKNHSRSPAANAFISFLNNKIGNSS